MSHPVLPDSARPCLWMSAGLLTYRLCDRDFDCERCPLDAALRRGDLLGSRDHEALLAPNHDPSDFPEDRRYTAGHSWVQVVDGQDGGRLRFGLDTFAAAIIGRCSGVTWNLAGRSLACGDEVCRLDLGIGALWITPVYEQTDPVGDQCGYHGYWARYRESGEIGVEPKLGDEGALDALLEDPPNGDLQILRLLERQRGRDLEG